MGKGTLALMGAVILGGSLLSQSIFTSSRARDNNISAHQSDVLARQIALSAMNLGIAEAKGDFSNAGSINYDDQPFQHGMFDLNSTLKPGGGIGLKAVGMIDGSQYQICSVLEAGKGGLLESAVLVEAEQSSVNYDGNKFNISGLDTVPPSQGGPLPGSDANVHGIGVSSNALKTTFESAASRVQEDNIIGVDGTLDIYHGLSTFDIDAFYASIVNQASITLPGGKFKGNDVYGSAASPEIVRITGDADITGTWEGFGVLLIEGDLSLGAGDFRWEGVVLVRSEPGQDLNVRLTGGVDIYGSLIIQTGAPVQNTVPTLDFYQSGATNITYSTEAIDRLNTSFTQLAQPAASKIRTTSYRESKSSCS